MKKTVTIVASVAAVLLFSVLVLAQSQEDENPNIIREALVSSCGSPDFFAEYNFETGIISVFFEGELEGRRFNQTEESFWTLVTTNRNQEQLTRYRESYIPINIQDRP